MFVAFSDGPDGDSYLGLRSLCSLHPRLYKFVALGDHDNLRLDLALFRLQAETADLPFPINRHR